MGGGGRRGWSEQSAWGVLKKISAGPCNFCCVSVWRCLPSKFFDLFLTLASFSAFCIVTFGICLLVLVVLFVDLGC